MIIHTGVGGGVGAGEEWEEEAEGWRRKRSRRLRGRFGTVRGVRVLDEEVEEGGGEREEDEWRSGRVGGGRG